MKKFKNFIGTINDEKVYKYTIQSDNNITVSFLNFGGIITEIKTPDKDGNFENIVLNFDDLEDYKSNKPYLGAIVGRVAGRIKNSKFMLNGKEYNLEKNDGNNSLHSGFLGFNKRFWTVNEMLSENGASYILTYLSEDGENGYPGNLNMEVTYTLTKDGEFSIEYRGVSDEDTILNPTNHTYFNLSGNAKRVIKDHILKVNSDSFIEVNQELIPTGKILDVKNTPFDFKNFKPVSEGMNSNYDQNIIVGNGYDHAFILNKNKNDGLYDIAVYDPVSKRELKVNTISKSVVIYTSNSMGDNFKVNGRNSEKYLGICLETQIEPDAISNPNFSSCILKKGEQFYSKTSFKFDVKQD